MTTLCYPNQKTQTQTHAAAAFHAIPEPVSRPIPEPISDPAPNPIPTPVSDPLPDPIVAQAKRDIDAGLVDTDMHATPGLNAALRAKYVPGPGGKNRTSGG